MNPPPILIVTGEVSGDLYGASLARACWRIHPGIKIFGVGARQMEEAGVRLLVNSLPLSVVGLTEVLSKWNLIKDAFSKVKKFIIKDKPGIVVLIDYPGFNLRLARFIKKRGIPLLYYISPQVWAWGKGRVKKIARLVDRMAVILPFEKEIYEKAGLEVEYVGHPLFEWLEKEEVGRLDRKEDEVIIGLLPGSRKEEVKRILPIMLRAARLIEEKRKPRFVLALAEGIDRKMVEEEVAESSLSLEIYPQVSHKIIKSADLVLLASGTATLEAAYFGTPMLIIYKLSFLTYLVAKAVVRTPWIGLVNILAGKKIAEEFIQSQAQPEKIASGANCLLSDKERLLTIRQELRKVKEKLKKSNPSHEVARLVFKMIKEQ